MIFCLRALIFNPPLIQGVDSPAPSIIKTGIFPFSIAWILFARKHFPQRHIMLVYPDGLNKCIAAIIRWKRVVSLIINHSGEWISAQMDSGCVQRQIEMRTPHGRMFETNIRVNYTVSYWLNMLNEVRHNLLDIGNFRPRKKEVLSQDLFYYKKKGKEKK